MISIEQQEFEATLQQGGLFEVPNKRDRVWRLLEKEELDDADRFHWFHLTSFNAENSYDGTMFDE